MNRSVGYQLGLALGTCVVVSACASVLGIEELGSGTGGAADGAGGTAPAGAGGNSVNNSGGNAGTGIGSTGGDAMGGTDVEGGVGTGGAATGGGAGQAVSDAGSGGSGDSGPSIVTVQGHVIDRWRHPMPAVPILINNKPVTTDAAGAFSLAGVQTPYDVYLVVQYSNGPYSWLYQGITRANPTLQVDTWVMPFRYAHYFDYSITKPNFPLPTNTLAGFSWGSPDGNRNSGLDGPGVQMDEPGWSGPIKSIGTSHALKWTSGNDSRPTGYNGYDFIATTLQDNAETSISLDLSKNPTITSLPASGTIAHNKLLGSVTDVYVTFSSGANIQVVDDFVSTGNTFSYLLPSLPGATGTVCVQDGAIYDLPFTIVHKNGLMPNTANVAITIPEPAVPSAPLAGATVSTTTDFSWTGDNVVYLFVGDISDPQGQDTHYRVLTAQKTARLPKYVASTGIAIPGNKQGGWHVETHGPYPTMDAATDVKGFVDPFDYSATIDGPVDRDGEMLQSAGRGFMTSATP